MQNHIIPRSSTRLITGSLFRLLSAMLLCLADAAADTDTLKILTLGDSITQAESNRASYRYPLWQKLVDAGIDFDLVGSMTKQYDHYNPGPAPQPVYKGLKFDPDHEGHFAWRTGEIITGRLHDSGSGKGRLSDWLKSYDVDIALIHLGTNDAFQRLQHEVTIRDLKTIISLLRKDNPKITIMLAQLIPAGQSAGDEKAIAALNNIIPQIARDMNTAESPVIVVDHFTDFDLASDTYDKVHPNASGEEKMAQAWFDAINAYLKSSMQK